MQRKIRFSKLYYFRIYGFNAELFPLLISCILLINCSQPSAVPDSAPAERRNVFETAVDINSAPVEELEKLPGIGEEKAKNIVAFRAKYGKFRRTENLILVRGMSDKKFRVLEELVKVE